MSSEVDYVGFANLPNQLHRKNVKKGFDFTLMVVGESGLGKSTLIKSIFKTVNIKERTIVPVNKLLESTVKIETNSFEMEESGVKLKITVVDTPGFGASLNASEDCRPITQYIDEQFEKYLNHETGLNRRHITDSRVHCCIYVISPESHGLKPLDIFLMKELQSKVNLVPIIGKSDFLTKDETLELKKRIISDLKTNKIQVYSIPDCDSDEDEDYKEHIRQLKASVPYAVASSLDFHEVKGRKIRGRAYPFGIVEIENPDHTDFVKLRAMLVSHLQDLIDVTKDLHYENYRTHRLVAKNVSNSDLSLKDNISVSSDDRDRALQEKEAEIRRMQEMIEKMQKQFEAQQREQTQPAKDEEPHKQNGHNV